MTTPNRYDLIGGTNGIPTTQVLRDQLGRVIKEGDTLVVNLSEVSTFLVISQRPSQDPRMPAGTTILELGARVQLVFPPSPTGSTSVSAMVAERLPEEQAQARAAAVGRALDGDGIAPRIVGGHDA